MSVRSIVTVPNTTLRQPSLNVQIDKKTLQFALDLQETLVHKDNPKGVGLSAPQLGKNWNMFVTLLSTEGDEDPTPSDLRLYINPVITSTSKKTTFGPDKDEPILEGCLSIPGIYGPVPRFEWVQLEYWEPDGNELVKKEGKFSGFLARVIQHEHDHLLGRLFTDYSLGYDLPLYRFKGKEAIEIDKQIIEAF